MHLKIASVALFALALAGCVETPSPGLPSVGSSNDLSEFQGARAGQAEMGVRSLGYEVEYDAPPMRLGAARMFSLKAWDAINLMRNGIISNELPIATAQVIVHQQSANQRHRRIDQPPGAVAFPKRKYAAAKIIRLWKPTLGICVGGQPMGVEHDIVVRENQQFASKFSECAIARCGQALNLFKEISNRKPAFEI